MCDNVKLTPIMRDRLLYLQVSNDRDEHYHWRPSDMKKLADMGFVNLAEDVKPCGCCVWNWRITPAGRAALEGKSHE